MLFYTKEVLRMNEIESFSEKLSRCDFIVLTPVNKGRIYCRFYSKGLYFDRMFVTNIRLLEELILLSQDEEIVDGAGIERLKSKYSSQPEVTDEEGLPEQK